jgi:hypothetical protein
VNGAHFAVRERRGVEARGSFRVLVEPEAGTLTIDWADSTAVLSGTFTVPLCSTADEIDAGSGCQTP